MHEKEELAEHIMTLGFNTLDRPWLVMISGDSHMLTYDDGSMNLYGGFPIFQCSPLDSTPSCKWPAWSTPVETSRGQYCTFKLKKKANGEQCLHFRGHTMDTVVMSHDVCSSKPPGRD